MVSIWGSKNRDEEEDDGNRTNGHDGSSSRGGQHEPDERTRLLQPETREGFLSPDDPAVSKPLLLYSSST
jgi:hypothetical protein